VFPPGGHIQLQRCADRSAVCFAETFDRSAASATTAVVVVDDEAAAAAFFAARGLELRGATTRELFSALNDSKVLRDQPDWRADANVSHVIHHRRPQAALRKRSTRPFAGRPRAASRGAGCGSWSGELTPDSTPRHAHGQPYQTTHPSVGCERRGRPMSSLSRRSHHLGLWKEKCL
jgi:hypothetical protein